MTTARAALIAEALERLHQWSRELGFQQCAVARLELDADNAHLARWLAAEYHGAMAYMRERAALRAAPEHLVPGTLSVISLRMNYLPEAVATAEARLAEPDTAYIARYALGRDYHKTIRQRLQQLAERLTTLLGPFGFRVFSDSAKSVDPTYFFDTRWALNAAWDQSGRSYAWVFGSSHTGGGHFLLGDGSVRFLSDVMDYRVYCLLNYIQDGEVTGEF